MPTPSNISLAPDPTTSLPGGNQQFSTIGWKQPPTRSPTRSPTPSLRLSAPYSPGPETPPLLLGGAPKPEAKCAFARAHARAWAPRTLTTSEVSFHPAAQPAGLRSGLPQVLVRRRRRARPGEATDQRVAAVGTPRPRPPVAAAFPQSPAPLRSCPWLVPNSLNRELWAGSRSRREREQSRVGKSL